MEKFRRLTKEEYEVVQESIKSKVDDIRFGDTYYNVSGKLTIIEQMYPNEEF